MLEHSRLNIKYFRSRRNFVKTVPLLLPFCKIKYIDFENN